MSTGGRVTPVTGAGRGIGEAIAPRLAADGLHVADRAVGDVDIDRGPLMR